MAYFLDVWLFEQEVDIRKVIYQPDEVCDAQWATKEEIGILLERGNFVPVFDYLDDFFKEYAIQ